MVIISSCGAILLPRNAAAHAAEIASNIQLTPLALTRSFRTLSAAHEDLFRKSKRSRPQVVDY